MFLNLNHYNLEVYKSAKLLRRECYKLFSKFPTDERYNLVDQIKRASTSVVLNISEDSSRKSDVERKRYYEISRGSVIEIDTCFELAYEDGYFTLEELESLGKQVKTSFILLSNLIKS